MADSRPQTHSQTRRVMHTHMHACTYCLTVLPFADGTGINARPTAGDAMYASSLMI